MKAMKEKIPLFLFLLTTLVSVVIFFLCLSFVVQTVNIDYHFNLVQYSFNYVSSDSVLISDPEQHPTTDSVPLPDYWARELTPDSVLLPDWELLLVSPFNIPFLSDHANNSQLLCLFANNATSPATFLRTSEFSNRSTVKCVVPRSVRRIRPLLSPVLTRSRKTWPEKLVNHTIEIYRWGFLAYEAFSTEDDVVLFAKGVNQKRVNRLPEELNCVFYNGYNNYTVITTVTSSSQEVFRCQHPKEFEIHQLFPTGDEKIKISLKNRRDGKIIVPSVAYYAPYTRKSGDAEGKSFLCATTMVYNMAKFLKEWVIYNSKLGVEKFLVYDNGSDDNLQTFVQELGGYNVSIVSWPWPKTQEAGFSHSTVYAKESCTWMMYTDVDEFIYSPSWLDSKYPSQRMLQSLLPTAKSMSSSLSRSTKTKSMGQVSVRCLEFGPSGQVSHPLAGVTQGYTCRRKANQRLKSMLLLEAVDRTLYNGVHYFRLKEGYEATTLSLQDGVVNHYKYQAWSEFKAKFRRRAPAYVADWKEKVNPKSNDRAPGLGFEAIEPKGWANSFCEVSDDRLKVATQKWFGLNQTDGSTMIWQS